VWVVLYVLASVYTEYSWRGTFFMLKRVDVGEKWKKILEQEWDVEFKKIMIHENLSGYLVIQDIYKP
jgi:hypothetical protein